MSFRKENLTNTRFYDLISNIELESRRVPKAEGNSSFSWVCAFDEERDIIFTQLISNDHEMRDISYWYLMLIGEDPIHIYYTLEYSELLEKGALAKYDRKYLIELVNEASTVSTLSQEPLFRQSE